MQSKIEKNISADRDNAVTQNSGAMDSLLIKTQKSCFCKCLLNVDETVSRSSFKE